MSLRILSAVIWISRMERQRRTRMLRIGGEGVIGYNMLNGLKDHYEIAI